MIFGRKITIIPVLLCAVFLAFALRLGVVVSETMVMADIGETLSRTQPYSGNETPAAPEDHAPASGMEEEGEPIKFVDDAKGEDGKAAGEKDKAAPAVDAPKWKDASDSDLDQIGTRMEVMEDMAKRREELDAQEKDLMTREALLKAAEKELDRKYQELSGLRTEIEKLLTQQSEEEKERITSLVKIYEGMKPKDAARIFDTLDLDILIAVMGQMSERRLSPILAAMNAERARTVTTMLAEQKQLPSISQN